MADEVKVPAVVTPAPPAPAKPAQATAAPPTITSKNLPVEVPPPGAQAPHVDGEITIDDDSDIVAKPLVSPDFTKLKPVNPAMSLRMVNRLALGGQRFEEARVQGFIVCKPSDIIGMDKPGVMTIKDGTVTYGDLIAMMMRRLDYLGAIKNNEENARRRVRRATVLGEGQKLVTEALNEVPGSRADKAKVKVFNPDI